MFILVKFHGKHAGKSQDNFGETAKIVRISPAIILWINKVIRAPDNVGLA